MIQVRHKADIHHTDMGWLSTHWHFSFSRYYDANHMGFGPLRVFNDDIVRPGRGFDTHPHREMEIVTYVIDGALKHKDSLGNVGVIHAGEVQRMSAGTGITHSEYNASDKAPVHLLQMWVTPAEAELPPSWEQKQFTKEQQFNTLLPIVSRQGGNGAVHIHQDVTFYLSSLETEAQLDHRFDSGRGAYLFAIEGALEINHQRLQEGEAAKIGGESTLRIQAIKPSAFILIDVEV